MNKNTPICEQIAFDAAKEIDREILGGDVKQAVAQAIQDAVDARTKQIADDLEIVYTTVCEGIEVPMLGSKKMSKFIDSATALRNYFESLPQTEGEKEAE